MSLPTPSSSATDQASTVLTLQHRLLEDTLNQIMGPHQPIAKQDSPDSVICTDDSADDNKTCDGCYVRSTGRPRILLIAGMHGTERDLSGTVGRVEGWCKKHKEGDIGTADQAILDTIGQLVRCRGGLTWSQTFERAMLNESIKTVASGLQNRLVTLGVPRNVFNDHGTDVSDISYGSVRDTMSMLEDMSTDDLAGNGGSAQAFEQLVLAYTARRPAALLDYRMPGSNASEREISYIMGHTEKAHALLPKSAV